MIDLEPCKGPAHIRVVSPFVCRMWATHGRLSELVTEQSCKEEIASFLQHGQKQPVLGRPIKGDSRYQFELIYGSRRLFVAQHLNIGLLVNIRDLTDREAFIETDIENRLRRDLSPYERGMAYKEWLRNGHFKSQRDIAAALGVSCAHVSRLMRFAELPAVVVRAFGDQTWIKESWGVLLADRCTDAQVKQKMTSVARRIASGDENLEPAAVMKLLLDCEEKRRKMRLVQKDTIVRSSDGTVLFRISYRSNDVHIILPRERVPASMLNKLTAVLKQLIVGESALKPPPAAPRAELKRDATETADRSHAMYNQLHRENARIGAN